MQCFPTAVQRTNFRAVMATFAAFRICCVSLKPCESCWDPGKGCEMLPISQQEGCILFR